MTADTVKTAHSPARLSGAELAARPRKVAQIMPVARDLFLDKGFDAVTMDMVTAKAGVSKATLYVYFASKEELFLAVVEEEVGIASAQLDIAAEPGEAVEAALRRWAHNFVSLFIDERKIALQRTVYGVSTRFPRVGALVFEVGPTKIIGRIAAFLAAAHDRGELDVPDPTRAAKQFISLARDDFDFTAMLAMPRPDKATIDASVEASIEMFMARYRRR